MITEPGLTRMPLSPAVVAYFLALGLTTTDISISRRAACLVLCYCWFNRADLVLARCKDVISTFGASPSTPTARTLPQTVVSSLSPVVGN